MATLTTPLGKASQFLANFRFVFMPLGLLALVAVGIHAAADLVDDSLLTLVERLDVALDALFAQSETTVTWVDRVGAAERTLVARTLTLAWELLVDASIALPMLAYSERDDERRTFGATPETWSVVLKRVLRQPTPMRIVRPVVTFIFALSGAYAVSRLVESTLFVGLQGDVTTPEVAQVLARILGAVAMLITVISGSWRATLRSLHSADAACVERVKAGLSPWTVGLWGSAISFPMAVASLLNARTLLSFFT